VSLFLNLAFTYLVYILYFHSVDYIQKYPHLVFSKLRTQCRPTYCSITH